MTVSNQEKDEMNADAFAEDAGEDGDGLGLTEPKSEPEERDALSKPKGEKRENELSKLKSENEELVKTLKRLQAEFENYQKRVEKEKAGLEERGKQAMLAKMILLADEFEAASVHMHKSSESELRSGIRLLHKKLFSLLEEEGIKPIECIGRKFDPGSCDAVEVLEDEGEEGIVAKEMRKGYVRNGIVLRHAMVGVTKKKKEDESKNR